MSRIVLYSMGYRGDVLPFVPVARELARRGHAVRFVCPREFHSLFRGESFQCVHSGTDFSPRVLDQYAPYVARWGKRLGGVLLPHLYFDKLTIPALDTLFEVIDAELATADLVASHPFPNLVARPAAERRGVRACVLDLFPMLLPSRTTSLPGAPPLPEWLTGWAWSAMKAAPVQRFPTFAKLRTFQARLGMDVEGWNFFDACRAGVRTIGLFSEKYQPRGPDWPTTYEIAGFTPWLGADCVALSPAVDAFLAAGDPPVLVTLGTNAASAHPHMFVAIAEALGRSGQRALVLASNDDVARQVRAKLREDHGVWPFVPLGPLLGHCRSVVHAGGHGTTAAVLVHGIPAAVVPAVTDQVWHARRIEELGLGVRVRRRRLAEAITKLVLDERLTEGARNFALDLATEDGPSRAGDLIERSVDA